MRLIKSRRVIHGILLLTVIVACEGCVMTKSQARLTVTFADATSGVATQNVQVLRAYQQLRETRILISDASQPHPAETFHADFQKYVAPMRVDITKAEAATRVLDEYGSTLKAIASDKYSNDLNTSAKTLGGSLGEAIKQANKAGLQLSDSIASTAAQAVRVGGGIFVRGMQYHYLKKFVNEGVQLIDALSSAIESELNTLEPHIVTTDAQGSDTAAKEFELLSGVGVSGFDLLQRFAEFDADRRAFLQRVKTLHSALPKLKTAQAKLAASLKGKISIESLIDSISALAAEVKSAQAIGKESKN